jgi:hypothetical protein
LVPFEAWTGWSAEAALRDQILADLADIAAAGPPPCKVTFVAERGWKTRVVTKSPGPLVAAAHLLRRIGLSSLRKDPCLSAVLRGDHAGAVLRAFQQTTEGDPVLLSADLTAATDHLDIEYSMDLWNGYCDGAGISDAMRRVGLLALGPMRVDDGRGEYVSRKGALMGLPLTWFILCLANIHSATSAIREARTFSPPARCKQPFLVCGDDLAAVWHESVVRLYQRNISLTGMRISGKSKHLVSKRYLIFTEEVFSFEKTSRREVLRAPPVPEKMAVRVRVKNTAEYALRRSQRALAPRFVRAMIRKGKSLEGLSTETLAAWKSFLESPPVTNPPAKRLWTPRVVTRTGLKVAAGPLTFPLRGVCSLSGRDPDTGVDTPWWAAVGPAATSVVEHHPGREKVIVKAFKRAHPGLKSWAVSRGFFYNLPRVFGGFGMPAPAPASSTPATSVLSRWVVRGATNAAVTTGQPPNMKLCGAWTSLRPGHWRSTAMSLVDEHPVGRYKFWCDARGPRPTDVVQTIEAVGPEERMERMIELQASDLTFMMGVEPSVRFKVPPRRIASAVRKKLNLYAKRSWRVRPGPQPRKGRRITIGRLLELSRPEGLAYLIRMPETGGRGGVNLASQLPVRSFPSRSAHRLRVEAMGWVGAGSLDYQVPSAPRELLLSEC